MLTDELQQLLLDYAHDELSSEDRARAEAVLAKDPSARRFLDEHRMVWSALGEAYVEPSAVGLHHDPLAADTFEARTVRRVRRAAVLGALRTWTPRLAAAAAILVAVSLAWRRFGPTDDRQVVRNLHLLQRVGFLQVYGEQLDLQTDVWIFKAFDGELEEDA